MLNLECPSCQSVPQLGRTHLESLADSHYLLLFVGLTGFRCERSVVSLSVTCTRSIWASVDMCALLYIREGQQAQTTACPSTPTIALGALVHCIVDEYIVKNDRCVPTRCSALRG